MSHGDSVSAGKAGKRPALGWPYFDLFSDDNLSCAMSQPRRGS